MIAGYALHRANFYQGANVIILSKGEAEAGEVLDYCRFMHSQLPLYLRAEISRNQESLLAFPAINSKIRALSATENAGIGFGGATLVILDENDFHPFAEDNYIEIKPMIDAGGNRQLIILSAPNRKKLGSNFKKLYTEAKAGENQFYPIFLPYNVIPERTEKWYEETAKDYEPWDMESRYPKTEDEALRISKALCYFDETTLTTMLKEDCYQPVEVRRDGKIKIFKKSVVGRRYCMAVDPAGGYDPFAVGIIDWQTCELVATAHGRSQTDELARIVLELHEEYNKCFTGVERNPQGSGSFLIDKLLSAGLLNQYKEKDKLGWYTNSANRPTMLDEWREAIYKRLVKIYNKEMIAEHLNFIQEEGKEPRASKGSHDDYVIMGAILWQIRKRMPIPAGEVKSYPYLRGN